MWRSVQVYVRVCRSVLFGVTGLQSLQATVCVTIRYRTISVWQCSLGGSTGFVCAAGIQGGRERTSLDRESINKAHLNQIRRRPLVVPAIVLVVCEGQHHARLVLDCACKVPLCRVIRVSP